MKNKLIACLRHFTYQSCFWFCLTSFDNKAVVDKSEEWINLWPMMPFFIRRLGLDIITLTTSQNSEWVVVSLNESFRSCVLIFTYSPQLPYKYIVCMLFCYFTLLNLIANGGMYIYSEVPYILHLHFVQLYTYTPLHLRGKHCAFFTPRRSCSSRCVDFGFFRTNSLFIENLLILLAKIIKSVISWKMHCHKTENRTVFLSWWEFRDTCFSQDKDSYDEYVALLWIKLSNSI